MYSSPDLESVCSRLWVDLSSSNCCFLTCIQSFLAQIYLSLLLLYRGDIIYIIKQLFKTTYLRNISMSGYRKCPCPLWLQHHITLNGCTIIHWNVPSPIWWMFLGTILIKVPYWILIAYSNFSIDCFEYWIIISVPILYSLFPFLVSCHWLLEDLSF